jgi:hypothetical protein
VGRQPFGGFGSPARHKEREEYLLHFVSPRVCENTAAALPGLGEFQHLQAPRLQCGRRCGSQHPIQQSISNRLGDVRIIHAFAPKSAMVRATRRILS